MSNSRNYKQQRIKYAGIGVGLVVLEIIAMTFLTPLTIGPIGIVAWFILLSIGIYLIALSFFDEITSVVYRRAGLITVTIVSILALQSLRQLSLRDIVLIIALAGLIEFYLTKSNDNGGR